MVKQVIFNTILNILIIASVLIGIFGYQKGNYFIPILCTAAFGLTLFYKVRYIKQVREEMRLKAVSSLKQKPKTKTKTKT
jgi:uncharacterized membrane protein